MRYRMVEARNLQFHGSQIILDRFLKHLSSPALPDIKQLAAEMIC
jgi:hypothetical protein